MMNCLTGVARIFQRGVTLSHTEGTHQIVPLILWVVCLQKGLKGGGGGGHGHPKTRVWLYALELSTSGHICMIYDKNYSTHMYDI